MLFTAKSIKNMDINKELFLEDPETNIQYSIVLSTADYTRAQRDDAFASGLLFHARSNSGPQPSTSAAESETKVTDEANIKIVTSWGYEQTIALIRSMENHFADLSHPKKRKHLFDNVANDLLSAGYNVNSITCQNKCKSLLRSYSKAKDTKTRTGQGPSRFLFFNLVDEVVGDKPTHNCAHSLNSLGSTQADQENILDNNDEAASIDEDGTAGTSSSCKPLPTKKRSEKGLKLEEYRRRQERHTAKMALEKEKLEVEKRKVKILEEYIQLLKK